MVGTGEVKEETRVAGAGPSVRRRRLTRKSDRLRQLKARMWDDWIETLSVLLLATASLATAWSGFQASEWSGEQSTLYSEASARRLQATEASTNAQLAMLIDIEVFGNYANAFAQGDEALVAFYDRQFSDRLAPAVEAWVALAPLTNHDAPPNPFAMAEYVVPERERANRLEAEAEELFARGIYANEQSGDYVLSTVYLATVLFFAGIVSRIRGRPARILLITMGISLLLYGAYRAVTLPVAG